MNLIEWLVLLILVTSVIRMLEGFRQGRIVKQMNLRVTKINEDASKHRDEWEANLAEMRKEEIESMIELSKGSKLLADIIKEFTSSTVPGS